MKPSEALEIHRNALRELMSGYGLSNPRVFGSVLTRTDDEDSDIDLLVEAGEATTLFTLGGAQQDAEALTGVRVSVLAPESISRKFRDQVLQQAQPL